MDNKKRLVLDIENLLNEHSAIGATNINPALLEFMDEKTLLEIIDNLLTQKEESKKSDLQWLESFKKEM